MSWTPPQRLLQDSLLASTERTPEKPALMTEEERLTYNELLERSLRIARLLQDEGLERGDRVALYLDNTAELPAALFGTLLAGGVFMVVNPQTKADKLAYVLSDSQAGFLFADHALAEVAEDAREHAPALRRLFSTVELPELLAGIRPEPSAVPTIPPDLAALIYTSGSTGQPKGVMMTHQSMVFAAGSIAEYLRLDSDDRILNVLPLAFDYGLYQLLMAMRIGGTLVLERSFAFPAKTLKRIDEEEVTVFPGVPTVFATLLGMKHRAPHPSVRRVTNTAAGLPPSFHDGLHELFPNALIFRMYGLTECKRVSYLEPELVDEKPTSVGKPIPGTEAFVLDEEMRPVAPGGTGILYVRGPHVMAGYWNLPEQTAHMLKDGPVPGERMLCTHDHFTIDEDGFLYFVGRTDDIIKTRGEKVSPLEVENALHGIPGVSQAAVLGVPDEVLGEAIRAYVVLDEGAEVTEQEIIKT
ncbi:MAG TPA: class I adenylate-forming enzyme family protein, partial [Gaiellaceae bacterium]|nr:class I adenylate-forming enzyme family protein [Gaiellaceae bacterium]